MDSSRGPWLGRLYALTVLLGAFLLFQVQPLLTKWILPWFGGGPAVWTTCLLFFQAALFAGYAYAHASERHLPDGLRCAVHLGLIVAAAALLPITPGDSWKPAGTGQPAAQILLLLGAKVGAPYFLLASTGPLVQAWFSRSYPDRSPYRLYALSNVGSLAALLTYPFAFEPHWGLRAQSTLWTGAFLLFASLSAAGAVAARRVGPIRTPDGAPDGAPPSAGLRALWVALPAFASWMLMALTQQLCQDLAVVPFLWVLPLAAYLLSFIIAFDHPRWYAPRVYAPLTAALVLLTAVAHAFHATHSTLLVPGIGVTLATLFCLCMLCHGGLARLKPAPRHLTGYYLAISGGGALGGLFVGLLAPRIFSTFLEWKLGLGIAYIAAWGAIAAPHRGRIRAHLNLTAVLLVVAVTGLGFIAALLGNYRQRVEVARNFYGVVTVEDGPDSRDLLNGSILHGRQSLRADRRSSPWTYYVEGSGIGRALGLFRAREDLRVGVVGLGTGTIAAYGAHPSQAFRFYEINPEVTRLAQKHFTYLKDCRARVDVVTGDGRLSLEREPPQRFHVLALDAFSGESIPTHLLTVEAMAVYLRHLDPDGVIAVHISNRFLDLSPVVRGVARGAGLRAIEIYFEAKEDDLVQSSTWVLCTRSEAAVRELAPHASKTSDAREIAWTDDRSDLLSILKFR